MTKFGHPPNIILKDIRQTRTGNAGTPVPLAKSGKAEHTPRKGDREKRVPLKGWEADWKADDGIVGWSKRQQQLEAKRDTKKPPSVLEADYYFPIQHRCPNVADFELFYKESLHSVFHPKEKNPPEQTNTCDVKLRLTTNGKLGVLTPIGFLEQDDAGDLNTAREITTYRDSKAARSNENLERRSRSVQDLHAKALERSNSYLRIKRLLKFSKDRKPLKADDDEDEGYSSKTSSAEQRCSESDGEESACNGERLEKKKIFSSMVDLSELPSNSKEHKDSTRSVPDPKTLHEVIAMGHGKFNYTHQPTILQLPNPDITLTHDKLRVEKKLETEDSHLSYAKLKRSRELNKGYKAADFINHPEESTVYSIDNGRPVTLVLRKISIQNADQQIPATYRAVSPVDSKSLENCSTAKPSSLLPLSRSGSALSMHGSTKSRAGSAVSRAGSRAGSRVGSSKRVGSPQGKVPVQNSISNSYPVDRTASLKYINSNSTVRDVRVVDNVTDPRDKEPMWSPQFSFIDRQTTNYCIGDLLPAMDKNIYNTTHSAAKLKFNAMDDEKAREDVTKAAERLHEFTRESQTDDGYLLLKKGMDILTGAADKTTLGPPPFRPNQTRHPLVHNQAVVLSDRRDLIRSSPMPNTKKNFVRVSSEKGTRTNPTLDEERETQKKLKEAFTEFYRNRPKEIGMEFRRMQTMWKT